MFSKRATPPRRTARHTQHNAPGKTVMKAASESSPLPPALSGPAAAVLVALVGAALVAVGLFLVGAREAKVGQWLPAVPPLQVTASG